MATDSARGSGGQCIVKKTLNFLMVVEEFMAHDCMRQNRLMIFAAAAHFWESSQFSKMDEIYFLITLMHA